MLEYRRIQLIFSLRPPAAVGGSLSSAEASWDIGDMDDRGKETRGGWRERKSKRTRGVGGDEGTRPPPRSFYPFFLPSQRWEVTVSAPLTSVCVFRFGQSS